MAAVVGFTTGLLVLIGWIFNIEILKTCLPGLVAMKANTALCLLLSGLTLWLQLHQPLPAWKRSVASGLELVVLLAAGFTLLEYQFGWQLGIDQLMFRELGHPVATSSPGRMATSTAVGLVLLALALLSLDIETESHARPAQYLSLAAATVGVFGVFAYCINFKGLYNLQSLTPMDIHTAAAFLALCVGVLFARPTSGLMAIVTSNGSGGAMGRRLSAAAILVPFVLAWLRMGGERAHYFPSEFGVALVATTNVFIFLLLIWWNARSLNRIEAQGRRGAQQLAAEYAVRRVLAESSTLAEAEPRILQSMGESLDRDVGTAWELKRLDEKLHCASFWRSPGNQSAEFEESTRKTTFGFGLGLPGRAWDKGEPVWTADVIKDAHFARGAEAAQAGLHASFAFPIVIGEEYTRVFEFFSREARAADEALLLMLDSVASSIKQFAQRIAAEQDLRAANEKLSVWVKDLKQRGNEITLLSQLGNVLQCCLTVGEAYKVVAQYGQELFPKISGRVYVIASSKNMVEGVSHWGHPNSEEQVFAPDDCWALRSGRLHYGHSGKPALICRPSMPKDNASYLCVPMMAQGESLGILHLRWDLEQAPKTEKSSEDSTHRQLALAVAEHISLAIANLRLRDALRLQSIRDPLTNLFNRRYLKESLPRELQRAARNNRPLGIIMLDIDHFKRYNDTFGHEAGHAVLCRLGEFLQTQVRGEDIACRFGGEEFTLILPDATLKITRKRAEQVREDAKILHVAHHGISLGTITLSLGVSVFPEHGTTANHLLSAADQALYQAKEQGRDKVVVWEQLAEAA